jgi:hypothetical protein
MERYANIIEQK